LIIQSAPLGTSVPSGTPVVASVTAYDLLNNNPGAFAGATASTTRPSRTCVSRPVAHENANRADDIGGIDAMSYSEYLRTNGLSDARGRTE